MCVTFHPGSITASFGRDVHAPAAIASNTCQKGGARHLLSEGEGGLRRRTQGLSSLALALWYVRPSRSPGQRVAAVKSRTCPARLPAKDRCVRKPYARGGVRRVRAPARSLCMPKLFPAICCHVSVEESALDIAPPSTPSTVCSDEPLLLALDREDNGARDADGTIAFV